MTKPRPFRLLVTGGRNWSDRDAIYEALDAVDDELDDWYAGRIVLVHGACPTGADKLADDWATERGTPVERYPAEWDRLGTMAGPIRNTRMVDAGADLCVAFWDGVGVKSGTFDCLSKAVRAGIAVRIVPAGKDRT